MDSMTNREKYLFDVQGWLVVPNGLDEHEITALNEALDANVERRRDETRISSRRRLSLARTADAAIEGCPNGPTLGATRSGF